MTVVAALALGAVLGWFVAALLATAAVADERAEWARANHRLQTENANLLEQLERQ